MFNPAFFYRGNNNSYLLDAFPGAAAAFSFRKLRALYSGFCIRIRRTSDNAILDVGFVNNYVDTNSINSFVGSGNALLIIFYDQSGNGNNAIANTLFPSIVISGIISTTNSKVSSAGKMYMQTVSGINPVSIFSLAKINTHGFRDSIVSNASNRWFMQARGIGTGSPTGFSAFDGTNYRNLGIARDLNRHYSCFIEKSGNLYITRDGASEVNVGTFTPVTYVNLLGGNEVSDMSFQEVVVYSSDKTSDASAIRTNMNNFYTIF